MFKRFHCVSILTLILAYSATAAEPPAKADPIEWQTTEKWSTLHPLAFGLPELPRDQFLIIFPEWITSREKNWHGRPTWKKEPNRAVGTWESDDCVLTITIQAEGERGNRVVKWSYQFTNDSTVDLTDVAAFNCFNLVDAPTFKDLSMRRTWVGSKAGKRMRLVDVPKTKGTRTMQFYPAKQGLPLTEFERFMRYGVTGKTELSGDRIGVDSADGKWTLQCIVEGRVAYFFNNWESDHGCIHAAPVFGNIPAGKTGRAQGRIVIRRETSND